MSWTDKDWQERKKEQDELVLAEYPNATKALFVGDLSFFCTERDLHSLFAQYGKVSTIEVKRGRHGDSLLHGFVEFDTLSNARLAMTSLNGHRIKGRRMRVNWTNMKVTPLSEIEHWTQIQVNFTSKNPAAQVTEEFLESVFAQFGVVTDCMVKRHLLTLEHPRHVAGFGFVFFKEAGSAIEALKAMQKTVVDGIVLDCTVVPTAKKADDHSQIAPHPSQQTLVPEHRETLHHDEAATRIAPSLGNRSGDAESRSPTYSPRVANHSSNAHHHGSTYQLSTSPSQSAHDIHRHHNHHHQQQHTHHSHHHTYHPHHHSHHSHQHHHQPHPQHPHHSHQAHVSHHQPHPHRPSVDLHSHANSYYGGHQHIDSYSRRRSEPPFPYYSEPGHGADSQPMFSRVHVQGGGWDQYQHLPGDRMHTPSGAHSPHSHIYERDSWGSFTRGDSSRSMSSATHQDDFLWHDENWPEFSHSSMYRKDSSFDVLSSVFPHGKPASSPDVFGLDDLRRNSREVLATGELGGIPPINTDA